MKVKTLTTILGILFAISLFGQNIPTMPQPRLPSPIQVPNTRNPLEQLRKQQQDQIRRQNEQIIHQNEQKAKQNRILQQELEQEKSKIVR